MTDGFPDRLTQLRTRWQGDPSSRIFLQLAEEYRHLGRVQDALEVLDTGLKEHPGYLSALVAKGRCLLELGDADKARGVLERVVQQDATQMVANKLLVRAYLETSEPERASQRLDLYSLLNDSDPEIEELRRRVVAMSRPPRQADGPRPEEPAERSRMDPTETPEAEVFDLGPAAPARSFAGEEDVFGLGVLPDTLPPAPSPSAPPAPPAPQAPLAPLAPLAALAPLAPFAPTTRGEGNGSEPFPDPAPEESRRRYLAGLWTERIFYFEDLGPAPAATAAATPEPAAAAAPAPAAPVAEEPAAAAEPAARPQRVTAPAAAVATVTLAELYLRQGHLNEARRLFGEVLEREPGNAAAREGLSRLASQAPAAAAPSPVSPAAPPPPLAVPEPAAPAQASQAPAAASVAMAPPPVVEAPGPEAAAPSPAAPSAAAASPAAPSPATPSPAAPSPAAASEPVQAAPRQPAAAPLTASALCGELLAGLDDPRASRKTRRAYLLQSYLARLRRQPRSPHVP
ncbi:MAG TPA: tetratricopeptide repeat protein [Thermoanaerobaculia bacterium]|nr:tetratricopeptide repeat protein [Thermoanaerobaculia bacterium]